MQRKIDVNGIIPPIATPFDEKGNIAHEALAGNVARLSQTNIRGILVLGSNGEYPYLSETENHCRSSRHGHGLPRLGADSKDPQ